MADLKLLPSRFCSVSNLLFFLLLLFLILLDDNRAQERDGERSRTPPKELSYFSLKSRPFLVPRHVVYLLLGHMRFGNCFHTM